MPTTTVRSWPNVQPAAADPELPIGSPGGPYYLPSANGFAMPANKTSWTLNIDQSNVPATSEYGLWIEYLVDGVWVGDAGSDNFVGGPINLRQGGTTFVNHLTSTIGDPSSQRPYPTAARVRVSKMESWLFPMISLTMA